MTAADEPYVHDHAHEHGDGHAHAPHPPARPDTDDTLTYYKTMEIAVRELLIEKGVLTADDVRRAIEAMDARSPAQGARIVAHAWTDPAYKARLMQDATAAIAELGYSGAQGEHMVVVENTPGVHNLVVCTLCSCYPWPVLGLPPVWYKSSAYRSRAVIDPRGVLQEFGLNVPNDVAVRVWDSTAEIRYLVLPERPAGTEGMSVEALEELVTRDTMIGTAKVTAP
jgi:nitrile hydratase subunit alpha